MGASLFVKGSLRRKHDEYGEWVFKEPKPKVVMQLPKCFGSTLSELQNKTSDDDQLNINLDNLDLDVIYDVLFEMLEKWPADKELTRTALEDLRLDVLSWLMQEAFAIVNESGIVSEVEEKNLNE